jgi:hypothetical protein
MTRPIRTVPISTGRIAPRLLCRGALLAFFTTETAAAEWSFDISIRDEKVTGERTLRVVQGDTVKILWRADRPMILHLHGYDIEVEAGRGEPAAMNFEARATGRFSVELHGKGSRHRPLLFVEVHPR